MAKYKYSTKEYSSEAFEYADTFETSEEDLGWVAQEMAEHDYKENDGWEWVWPVTYLIWDTEGNLLGRFMVSMEPVPEFWATKIVDEAVE